MRRVVVNKRFMHGETSIMSTLSHNPSLQNKSFYVFLV